MFLNITKQSWLLQNKVVQVAPAALGLSKHDGNRLIYLGSRSYIVVRTLERPGLYAQVWVSMLPLVTVYAPVIYVYVRTLLMQACFYICIRSQINSYNHSLCAARRWRAGAAAEWRWGYNEGGGGMAGLGSGKAGRGDYNGLAG